MPRIITYAINLSIPLLINLAVGTPLPQIAIIEIWFAWGIGVAEITIWGANLRRQKE